MNGIIITLLGKEGLLPIVVIVCVFSSIYATFFIVYPYLFKKSSVLCSVIICLLAIIGGIIGWYYVGFGAGLIGAVLMLVFIPGLAFYIGVGLILLVGIIGALCDFGETSCFWWLIVIVSLIGVGYLGMIFWDAR
ncbi:hypothetical protein [Photobacterium galatheae]|uniref:Uncharacterized protein n=1 Tax=Photobacterium galatheae TaxID=1654360 RepID=A0A066RWQ4_9GAMM|nr:hypothetical protein [Photobacterium galatheae]KDM91818.1 hypothetical protein EA58_09940 [Photobacterium galatheae]MCM0147087.1 hypothetical protein [Photobacterium galatheae]